MIEDDVNNRRTILRVVDGVPRIVGRFRGDSLIDNIILSFPSLYPLPSTKQIYPFIKESRNE